MRVIWFLLVLSCLSTSACASFISLGLSITSPEYVEGGEFPLYISLVNMGDETAKNAVISLHLPDGSTKTTTIGDIEINIHYQINLSAPEFQLQYPGLYFGFLTLEYTDANTYPFSVVAPFYVRNIKDSQSDISHSAEAITIAAEGTPATAIINVKNEDSKAHNISLNVFSPNELHTSSPQEPKNIGSGENIGYRIPVGSKGALEGSEYSIYYTIEYVSDGIHKSAVGDLRVKISSQDEVAPTSHAPAAALAILILSFIAYQLYSKIRGR
jgi:hypothetical protein